MTTVTVERLDETFHFRASNEQGCTVDMDSIPDREGPPKGSGPMQLLLMALGGCSGMDVVMILNKARQEIDDFRIEISGQRTKHGDATPYSSIHASYMLTGNVDTRKAIRAVKLSIEKYCSVAKTLELLADITYSCSVNGIDVPIDEA
ncbi:MAG: OsmC family protein [Rhodothermales bacterium]|nr:OsmC family protein [Rhodothermales bacterium]